MKRRSLTLVMLLLLGGCASDDPAGPTPSNEIELTLSGFPEFRPFDGEGHFELWIAFAETGGLRHESAVSVGKFRTDANGQPVNLDFSPLTFSIDPSEPDADQNGDGEVDWPLAVDAFISIQEPGSPDRGPVFLGGNFVNREATLRVSHGDAFGTTFAVASGSFLLATPSTATGADETNGMWFVQPGGAAPSLTLPALPSGWRYGGWAFDNFVGSAELGEFSSPMGADSDSSGPFVGQPPTDSPGYAFPGSDFPFGNLDQDLSNGSVNVTLEPVDTVPRSEPFFLYVLGGPVPAGVGADTSIPMLNSSASFPTASIRIPGAVDD
jgi:hypothetical protein